MPFRAFPGTLNSWEAQNFPLHPPLPWLSTLLPAPPPRWGCEHLWTRPRADAPAEFAAPGDTPLPSQTLKIRLCQLQKRCHHEWKLWGLGHRVTSQKDMDSYNVSLICGMGVRAGLRAAVSSVSITPHKLTPLTLTLPPPHTHTHTPDKNQNWDPQPSPRAWHKLGACPVLL